MAAVRQAHARSVVVFDLDGTLVDSHAAIVGCFGAACAERGLPAVDPGAVASLIGLPLGLMFDRLLPDHPAAERGEAIRAFSRAYPDWERRSIRLFSGVIDVVSALRDQGLSTAIATSKSRVGLDRVLRELALSSLFDAALSNDCVTRKKPDPEMLREACRRVGAAPGDAVMVGDTTFDVQMGRAAGARAVGVTWGAHDRERLQRAGADAVVDDAAGLAAALGCAAR